MYRHALHRNSHNLFINTLNMLIRPGFNFFRGYRVFSTALAKRWYSQDHVSKSNIILMGSPGCGKTTVGRILSSKLGLPVLDIDDDHLEPYWNMTVSQKLSEVGSDGFVEAEGLALKTFNASGSIISLTGSNPMHNEGMTHIAKTGTVVFLDVHMQDIIERLERMKVNRIVGQNDGTSMSEILKFRQQFYESWYDIRVICEPNEDPDTVSEKVLAKISDQNSTSKKGYASTRGEDLGTNQFNDVLLKGLADDGGLIVPKRELPTMSLGQLSRLVDLTYPERAVRILEQLVDYTELHPSDLKKYINKAYNPDTFASPEICPIRPIGDDQFIQELFHGPTASFKDIALQLMPQMFMHAVQQTDSPNRYIILVATSGDTGGAVLDGFTRHAGNTGTGVIVLYPDEGISEIQRDQMIAYNAENTRVIGVQGADFDFCQTNVKRVFADTQFADKLMQDFNLKLSAANSISLGRLLPQIVYHMTSYLDLVRDKVISMGDEVDLCVPTGNFGNILSAYYAKVLGIPYRRLVCASNSNNVLTDFLNTGCYDVTQRRLAQTISPAIDILVSSNLERLLYHMTNNDSAFTRDAFQQLRDNGTFSVPANVLDQLRELFHADWCTEVECAQTIKNTFANTGYLLDPHTSVAKTVADRTMSDRPMIISSTAHPGKFSADILRIFDLPTIGQKPVDMLQTLHGLSPSPGVHRSLLHTLSKPASTTRRVCDANYESVISEINMVANKGA